MSAEIHELITIAAPSDRVFDAISTRDGLASWWTSDVETTAASVTLGFERRSVIFRMKIEQSRRPELLAWSCTGEAPEWTGTRLTFAFRPENGGTAVRLTHAGWQSASDYMAACTYTWAHVLDRLKSYAENGKPVPYFT
jgi:uncharacterized protein YndB with AHSA1/START domain